jgi:hypothetical protein
MNDRLLIPVHNRREVTLSCLRHLQRQGDLAPGRAIVIDDGSTDGTRAAVGREFPDAVLLSGSGDLWWTGAIALGMEAAFGGGAEAVYWLNDDCLPDPGTLAALEKAGEGRTGGQRALAAPVCVSAETGAPVPTAFSGRVPCTDPGPRTATVDGLSGYCVRIPRVAWERLGGPDPHAFPHYYGDTAYTLKASRAGLPCLLLGSARARLVHYAPRPAAVADYVHDAAGRLRSWPEVFRAKRSPFRLATQRAYLRLRYGAVAGTVLGFCRGAAWQWSWWRARSRSRGSLPPPRRSGM